MEIMISVLHYILCFLLIGAILLQAGKGADIGATFGAGSSQTVFGPRGAATFLSKLTAIVAVLFLLTSVSLARCAHRGSSESVLEKVTVETEAAPGTVQESLPENEKEKSEGE
jgi:preprotein translocase subunit SecG